MDDSIKFESLDTSYVSLASLIRYLRERNFVGRLHVALDQYEADVFLYGSEPPSVWESDHSSGRGAQGEEALDRLLVRSREPGGLITVFEQAVDEQAVTLEPTPAETETSETPAGPSSAPSSILDGAFENPRVEPPAENVDWFNLLKASGELIAAVERAVVSSKGDFGTMFRGARVEIGDDFPFLDPSLGGFEYAHSVVQLRDRPSASAYVTALTECLRRLVNRMADDGGARFRERVAVELVVAARKHPRSLAEFKPNLDRIAGTRVL